MPTLRDEKMRALQDLIGRDNAAKLVSSLKERDQMASNLGIGYKSTEPVNDTEIADALKDALTNLFGETPETETAETEKCTPGTKDGKYMSKKAESKKKIEIELEDEEEEEGDEEEDEAMEDEEEMSDDDMILSTAEIKAIAGEVAKAMASSMSELKAELKGMYTKKKSRDDDAVVSTLKEYTDTQNEFGEKVVEILEELLTRVKSLEEHGTGYSPSSSASNVSNMRQVHNMTPEQHVENWLFSNR
jgi:hypothetical protein